MSRLFQPNETCSLFDQRNPGNPPGDLAERLSRRVATATQASKVLGIVGHG